MRHRIVEIGGSSYLPITPPQQLEPLVRAYCEAYERGADRYSAIVEQERQVDPLEIQYFRELKECVADYVSAIADNAYVGHPAEFAATRFAGLDVLQREWLAERVAEIVVALHEGNIIAWGVDRRTWQQYLSRMQ